MGFTKWTEAIPLKKMNHCSSFLTEHIVHWFDIPQNLTTDQGSSFLAKEVTDFAETLGIKMLSSSPYYSQANRQAESSNKTLLKLIKKKIHDHPKQWHEVLSKALWAHRVSRHGSIKVTPFELAMDKKPIYM
jgi:transposase InsO family protein